MQEDKENCVPMGKPAVARGASTSGSLGLKPAKIERSSSLRSPLGDITQQFYPVSLSPWFGARRRARRRVLAVCAEQQRGRITLAAHVPHLSACTYGCRLPASTDRPQRARRCWTRRCGAPAAAAHALLLYCAAQTGVWAAGHGPCKGGARRLHGRPSRQPCRPRLCLHLLGPM